jgi:RNA polymerase sigma-70 factor (ECF subfamily)
MPVSLTSNEAAQLVARVVSGDREAYAPLVDAYQFNVRAVIARYFHSAIEVEELAHQAFVDAYIKLKTFDSNRGAFLSWLRIITRNVMIDELRRRRSALAQVVRYSERVADHADSDQEKTHMALECCLSELSTEEIKVINARYARGSTSDEIAASAGKSAVAVRRLLQRLRERLRLCIEKHIAATDGGL